MQVNEIMNNQPLYIAQGELLDVAIPLMVENESSCLIVVDQKQPVGIITERDITRLVSRLLKNPELIDAPVESIMTSKPICVYEDHALKEALLISRSHSLRHLPVVNSAYELVGVVTQDNLVDSFMRLMAEHAELESNMESLKLLSLEDPLTGVGNRRAMEVELKHTQAQATRSRTSYAVALLDIDFFKKFNDYYGHQAGDEALRKVAQQTQTVLRDADRLFRYGGEEFLIVMPNTEEQDALTCCERVRKSIEAMGIENHDATSGLLTVSIGMHADVAGEWQVMVKRADKALYAAKAAGRNTVKSA